MSLIVTYSYEPSTQVLGSVEQVAMVFKRGPRAPQGVPRGYPLFVGRCVRTSGSFVPRSFRSEAAFLKEMGAIAPLINANALPTSDTVGVGSDYAHLQEFVDINVQDLPPAFPCVVVPVNTDFGQATLARQATGRASVASQGAAPFYLRSSYELAFEFDTGGPLTATFVGHPKKLVGSAGQFTSVEAGEKVEFVVRGVSYEVSTSGAEASLLDYLTLIASNVGGVRVYSQGGELVIEDYVAGTDSDLSIGADSSVDFLLAIGMWNTGAGTPIAATQAAGSNVANIDAVTVEEAAAVIDAACSTYGSCVASGSQLVLSSATDGEDGSVQVTDDRANTEFAFPSGLVNGGADPLPAVTVPAGLLLMNPSDPKAEPWFTTEDAAFAEDATSVTVKAAPVKPGVDIPNGSATLDARQTAPYGSFVATVANCTTGDMDAAFMAAETRAGNPNDTVVQDARWYVELRHTEASMAKLVQAAADRSTTGRYAYAFVSPKTGVLFAEAGGTTGVGSRSATAGGRTFKRCNPWGSVARRILFSDGSGGSQAVVWYQATNVIAAVLQGRLDPGYSIGQPRPDIWNGRILGVGPETSDIVSLDDFRDARSQGLVTPVYDADLGFYFYSPVTTSTEPNELKLATVIYRDYLVETIGRRAKRDREAPATAKARFILAQSVRMLLQSIKDATGLIVAFTVTETTTADERKNEVVSYSVAADLAGNLGTIKFGIAAEVGLLA